jgi:hypothetical protein
MLVLLVLSSIAAALIPVERDRTDSSTTSSSTTSTTTTDSGEARLIKRTVSTSARKRPTIEMRVGDQLELTVKSPVANAVEIEAFGEFEDVDPAFPAKFNLFPLAAGSHAVRLVDPPGLVATIRVRD